MRYSLLPLILLFVLLTLVPFVSAQDNTLSIPELQEGYRLLLDQFPANRPGFGDVDELSNIPNDQAMTYGLVLSAEVYRYHHEPSETGKLYIRNAVEWILDSADADNDGLPGWGLPNAWDAFNDGSINPANHPYTITTAHVIFGLLDALSLDAFWTTAERNLILQQIESVGAGFCREVWEETSVNGVDAAYFWYSPAPVDAYFVQNVSSMLAGVLSRYLAEYGNTLATTVAADLQNCVDKAALGVVAAVQFVEQSVPIWNYSVSTSRLKSPREVPNDLVHHGLIVFGIELYRDFGDKSVITWSREDAIKSLELFDSPVGLQAYHKYVTMYDPSPANLWGIGMTLAFQAFFASSDEAGATTIRNLVGNYGYWDGLQLYPRYASQDNRFYPRQAAYVLWGLGAYVYQ